MMKPSTKVKRVDAALVRVLADQYQLALRRKQLEAEQRRLNRKEARLQERRAFLIRTHGLLDQRMITKRVLDILHRRIGHVTEAT